MSDLLCFIILCIVFAASPLIIMIAGSHIIRAEESSTNQM